MDVRPPRRRTTMNSSPLQVRSMGSIVHPQGSTRSDGSIGGTERMRSMKGNKSPPRQVVGRGNIDGGTHGLETEMGNRMRETKVGLAPYVRCKSVVHASLQGAVPSPRGDSKQPPRDP